MRVAMNKPGDDLEIIERSTFQGSGGVVSM